MAVAGVLAGGKLKEAASDFRHADSGHRGAGLGNALLGVAETAVGAMGDTVRASVQGGDHRRHERRADQGD
jgi:hypothetical protein